MSSNAIENGGSNMMLPQKDGSLQEDLLHIALRHRWTILLTTVLFLVTALAYLIKATPIFTSHSRLYVEQMGPKIISEYEGIMTRSGNYLYTQSELLKSTPVLGDAVDTANMRALKTFANVDNPVGGLRNSLSVSVGRKDDIITVSFESPYPAEAAQVVNAVVASYVNHQSTSKHSSVSEVKGILGKEKEKRDTELIAAFEKMLDFTRENGVVSFDGKGGNIIFERLSALSGALTDAELASLTAKADLEAVRKMKDDAVKIRQFAAASTGASVRMSVADKETQLQSELRQVETELKDALYHCTEEHPSVQAIHAKIDRIRKELDDSEQEFADAYLEVMQLRWMTAKEREEELRDSFDAQHLAARDLGVKAAEYAKIQSELDRAERICAILDDRIKELNVTEDVGALNISILEVARPADGPSKPQRARIMTMALALGLMAGASLAFLRDWFDFRLRSSEEASAILGIPVLGVVPKMASRRSAAVSGENVLVPLKPAASFGDREAEASADLVAAGSDLKRVQEGASPMTETRDAMERGQKLPLELESVRWIQRMSMNKKADRSARTAAVRGESRDKTKTPRAGTPTERKSRTATDRPEIVIRGQKVHLESRSVAAEAYRTIRTAVFFGAPKDDAKTILITSPAPGDGKSTLASNLAIAMAQAGQKTLIIDADFRKPVQHKIFEVDDDRGLSSVLAGRDTIEQAVQPGIGDGLDVLACGPEVPNPSELLNSDVFNATLTKLSEQYDRVIVDSPPVGLVADAQILAAICDITVLILRAEKSTRRQAQHARDSLLSVGAQLLGAVVNDVPQRGGQYGYYSSYGNYGYYGKREKKTG